MNNFNEILSHYGIKGEVKAINHGPLINQIEFLPAPGTKLKNIMTSIEDIAREMGEKSLRVSMIDDSNTIGFEYPKEEFQTIDFQSVLESDDFQKAKGALPICLGVDVIGRPIFADLAKMPHLLVAGTTGSGKSVGLNTFVLSLIARKKPTELKFVMIDPKCIEFSVYNNQKYLLYPVITENNKAIIALQNLVNEMEKRYSLFEENMVRNISEYNASTDTQLAYIVCVIDEFADLMAADKDVSLLVQRLAQKARAAGIHLIMATQRPSVDVVTGVLKANFPTRLSYKVASGADSRTILDTTGAENLIGRGDALFLASDGNLKRIHGAFVTDQQITQILAPFKAKVAPLEENNNPNQYTDDKEQIKQNCVIEFWCSLRSSERKTIISWILSMIKYLIKTLINIAKK